MKHHRILLLVLSFWVLTYPKLLSQHMQVGGVFQTSSVIDSLRLESHLQKKTPTKAKILTKFQNKTGRLSVNLEVDVLRFSPFRNVESDSLQGEYPPLMTQKKFQLQLKLGIHIRLHEKKRKP